MTHDPTPPGSGGELARLEKLLETQQAVARTRSRTTLALAGLLAVTILGFAIADYVHVRSHWTEDTLQASLHKEMEELAPAAQEQIDELGAVCLPVFAEEGREQLSERWPEMSGRLLDEADRALRSSVHHANTTVHQVDRRTRDRVRELVVAAYPDFDDPTKQDRIVEFFEASCEGAVASAIDRFQQRFRDRLTLTEESIGRIGFADGDTVELQKRFLQLWLGLLEEEIMQL